MTPVSAPLRLSAAGIRVAGYMIERQLRAVQVLGQAALDTNPFIAPVCRAAPAVRTTVAASAPAPDRPEPAPLAPASVTEPVAEPEPARAIPAAPVAETKARDATQPARSARRPRQPSKPPAMPEVSVNPGGSHEV